MKQIAFVCCYHNRFMLKWQRHGQFRAKRLSSQRVRHVWHIACCPRLRVAKQRKSQVKRNIQTWHRRVRSRLWVHVASAKRIDLEKRKNGAINLRIARSHRYKEQRITRGFERRLEFFYIARISSLDMNYNYFFYLFNSLEMNLSKDFENSHSLTNRIKTGVR